MVASKPKRLLPSEIGRLVYGYLGKVSCSKTQKVFLEENKVLKEIASYVEKELIRSIDMEIEGQQLEDILNGYLTIKFEIDKLFDELQVKKPDLYAFRSDGPLRKLKVLDGHWKSQPAHHKHLDRSQVVEIEAANSEAHRMLSKKTCSPASTTKRKSESLQLPAKESDLCPTSPNPTSNEAETPSHSKSRKKREPRKSKVPTRGVGISMPILSGYEIQDEVKKRIEAFTQKTDEKIINSVVAEPLAHILARTSEVDTAVENFLSNEDLLNNFTQVLDEVWATDCKKVNAKPASSSTSGLLSTPQHQSNELIDSYVEQESCLSPSSPSPSIISNDTSRQGNGAQMSTSDEKETIRSLPASGISNNQLKTSNKNPPEDLELQGMTSHNSRKENVDIQSNTPSSNNEENVKSPESTNLCELNVEKQTFSGQNIQSQGDESNAGRNDPLSSEVIEKAHKVKHQGLEVPVVVSEVPLNPSQTFMGPLPKRQPRELPLLAEQEVHLVNPLPSQTNDAENQRNISNSISSPRSTPHVIVVHQNQSSTDRSKDAEFGVSFNEPSPNLVVVMPESGEPLQPHVIIAPGPVNEHQADGASKPVEGSSELKKVSVHHARKARSAKVEQPKKTLVSNLQDSKMVRKSNRLAQKSTHTRVTLQKSKASTNRKPPSNNKQKTSGKDIHKSPSTIILVNNDPWITESQEPKNELPACKTLSDDIGSSIQGSFVKTVSTNVLSLYHLDENARESLTLSNDSESPFVKDLSGNVDMDHPDKKDHRTSEASPSFRQIFQAKETSDILLSSTVSPHLPSADNCGSDIEQVVVEDNKTGNVPLRQDSEGSQTVSSFSLPFSPPNLSISSTILNEILKTSCGSMNFSGLSSLFTESFDLTSNTLPEQKVANEDHHLEGQNVNNFSSLPSTFKLQSSGINFSKSPKQSSTPRSSTGHEASNPVAEHVPSQLPHQTVSKASSSDSQTKPNSPQIKVTPLIKDFVSPSKRLPRKVPLVRVPITGVRIQPGQFCSQWEEQHNVNNLDNYTTRATKQQENLGSSTDTLESDKNSDDNSEVFDLDESVDLQRNKRVKKRKRMSSCEREGSEPKELDKNSVPPKRKISSPPQDFDDPGFAEVPDVRQNGKFSNFSEPSHFHMENQDHCSTHLSQTDQMFVNYQVYFEQEPYVEDLSNGD